MLALVTDRGPHPEARLDAIRAAVDAGVDWVQIRDRGAAPADLVDFAKAVRVCCDRAGARLVINRRVDVALACEADGVHLGFDALEIAEARACWAAAQAPAGQTSSPVAPLLVGRSTHSPEEALRAWQAGADYVHLAPIYPPLSKRSERPPLGPSALSALRDAGVAVIAQGGIETPRLKEVVAAGAIGVAVTGAILGADDSGRAALALRSALDRGARA